MVDLKLDTSIITWNVNITPPPMKRQRSSDCIKKQNPSICFLQKTHFKHKDTNKLNRFKVKGWENMLILTKRKLEQLYMKVEFRAKNVTRIKGVISRENYNPTYVCTYNVCSLTVMELC